MHACADIPEPKTVYSRIINRTHLNVVVIVRLADELQEEHNASWVRAPLESDIFDSKHSATFYFYMNGSWLSFPTYSPHMPNIVNFLYMYVKYINLFEDYDRACTRTTWARFKSKARLQPNEPTKCM